MIEDPDAPLVARSRAGDTTAFDELVARHGAQLSRVIRRYLRAPEEAADATQETFLRALERLGTFRGEAPFKSWLFRIGVNVALTRLRVASLYEPVELEDDAFFTNSLGTTKLVAAELWRKLGASIQELPPRQRLVVELRVLHELSFDEIAVLVGSTEEAARVNFHHAMKRLRAQLVDT